MFKVKVLTLGISKETWLREAIGEYEKRFTGKLQIEWKLAKQRTQLIEWGLKESFLLCLDPGGTLLNSETFSQKLMRLFMEKGSLTFLIGDADGIPSELFQIPHQKWSLSPLTFTHQMTRLILVEQIYRALEIDAGSAYHK